MNRIINLTKRVKTAEELRYCPVVEAANGRVKPDVVVVNGQEERTLKAAIISIGLKARNECGCRLAAHKTQPLRATAMKQIDFSLLSRARRTMVVRDEIALSRSSLAAQACPISKTSFSE